MKKQKSHSSSILFAILLLVIGITIGYATLSTTLKINGQSTIQTQSWDVKFTDIAITPKSATTTKPAALKSDSTTTIEYEVTLDKPGDFYEFTAKIENNGTIDAKLSGKPVLSGVDTEADVYTNYTATWDDGTEIKGNEELAHGDNKTIKVRVEYDKNINATQLPGADKTLSLTCTLNYVQK